MSSKVREVYGDRFIPSRESDLTSSYNLLPKGGNPPSTPTRSGKRKIERGPETDLQKGEANKAFDALLKSELLGSNISLDTSNDSDYLSCSPSANRYAASTVSLTSTNSTPASPPPKNLFSFDSPARKRRNTASAAAAKDLDSPTHDRYSSSPVRYQSQKLLLSPRKAHRSLSKVPFKVLDAPQLADDFYLNLVDWSYTNILAVGLRSCVYLWSPQSNKVTRLCDLSDKNDIVTGINWAGKDSILAIGTASGSVQIWDADKLKLLRTMSGHSARVGALAWRSWTLSSGSKDRLIYHRDVRAPDHWSHQLNGHKQEVCGLKWNPEGTQLASGGNDNKLFVWNHFDEMPLHRFADNTAAVKAIAWNPHHRGVLASGGGTADKRIRFWNTLTGSLTSEIDTGSQVCNLVFSKNTSELCSTHGFSHGQTQNSVCIWKYPSMQRVATLSGHTYRVLYLALSPEGQTIVTGAADETLRFWNVFEKSKPEKKDSGPKLLNPFVKIR